MSTRRSEKVHSRWTAGACAFALAAFAVAGYSQAPAPMAPPNPPMDGGFAHFVGFEGDMGGRVVTGAPYSATVTSEFTQTLSDGTVIDRKTAGSIARDSEGRTRRETTLPAIGPFATSGAPPTIISINDPVAHKRYVLNPTDKTARELGGAGPRGGFGGGRDGGHGGGGGGRPGAGGHDGPDGGHAGAMGGHGHDGGAGIHDGGEGTTVSLGMKTVEGVSVEGTRTTRTIPAGAMGNAQPIVISFERWYSPDLLTNVMTVRSDPFTGKTVFKLTNISRSEPDASLFSVPSDYKMMTGGMGKMGMHPGGMGGSMGPGGPGQKWQRGGGPGGNSGGAPNSTPAPMPPPAPGQGQGQGQDD